MFRIKICGLTSCEDAEAVVAAGADAIGLNFYPGSKRCIELATARAICRSVGGRATIVGVFVNADAAAVRELATSVPLDLVQLHGDETPEQMTALSDLPLIRAIRWQSVDHLDDTLRRCQELDCPPQAVLIDAFQSGQYGGTGTTADWKQVAKWHAEHPDTPLILAGGLNPENVASAIAAVRPTGVDTASGVESMPGRKDATQVAAFVAAARAAFNADQTG